MDANSPTKDARLTPTQPPPRLGQLGALRSLGAERDLADAALLLEVFGTIEGWCEREPRMRSASNKLFAYSFGAIWTDSRAGAPVAWRLGWSGVPWSAAARALLELDADGQITVRRSPGARDPLSLEHVVPKGLVFAKLLVLSRGGTPADAVKLLHDSTRLAVVTKAEGAGRVGGPSIRAVMRRSALPPQAYLDEISAAGLPWQWARYLEVGHELESFVTLGDALDLDPAVRERLRLTTPNE